MVLNLPTQIISTNKTHILAHQASSLPLLMEASRLCKDPGFILLDSSFDERGGMTLLASKPSKILEGHASQWHLLEKELEYRQRHSHLLGVPNGAAIGYFRFDGSFCFGFYDHLHLYRNNHWISNPPCYENETLGQSPMPQIAPRLKLQSDMTKQHYLAIVRQAQEYIAAGDIYQVCLAHRFSADFSGDSWSLYLALRKTSPAPYAAYINLGGSLILSSSPECFLKMSGRKIVTRPIKGTRARGRNLSEDEHQAYDLQTSSKERAELIMITDLERNDLGRICKFGTVVTTELLHLERYAQVFHLVSTVEGELRGNVSHVAALVSCFPGGSISGAPKKRAIEIIQELEPSPRGLFTGAIGYFGYNGESQFSIAIRTLVIQDGHAEFYVGAGITIDSEPEKEWDETFHKASGILQASSMHESVAED